MFHNQSIYDLNALFNETNTTSYGVDSFDLSLLGSEYSFDANTQIKYEDFTSPSSFTNNLALSIEIDNCQQYPTQSQLAQAENQIWNHQQSFLQSSSLLSPISPSATVASSPSPCPSIDYVQIKQEHQIFLPPSPPESNGVPSPQSFKIEQFDEQSYSNQMILSPSCTENSIDINFLLDSNNNREQKQQDHQVLREFLQDTSFQRKHNLKPLALESLFGSWTQQGDIEPVISLALQHAKQEVQATCKVLKISSNPEQWTVEHVQLWINSTTKQFKLEPIEKCEAVFPENGEAFVLLSDEEFIQRAPHVSSMTHYQTSISLLIIS